MPHPSQKTITLMKKHIPKHLLDYCKEQDRSVSSVVRLCIWLRFGDTEQKKIAKQVLGEN